MAAGQDAQSQCAGGPFQTDSVSCSGKNAQCIFDLKPDNTPCPCGKWDCRCNSSTSKWTCSCRGSGCKENGETDVEAVDVGFEEDGLDGEITGLEAAGNGNTATVAATLGALAATALL